MQNYSIKVTLVALFPSFPLFAKANMIWPSIYIVQQYYAWYIILSGLIIEIFAAKKFLKIGWKMAIWEMFVANLISALIGLLLIPISGIMVEVLTLPFNVGTFDLSHWILDYIFVVLANTCVEGLSLKWIFKHPFKSNFWWLFCANLISVIICAIIALILFLKQQ